MMEYIRRYYNVPAKKGTRVLYDRKYGIITGSKNGLLRIRMDGDSYSELYHPTYHITYLEAQP